MVSLSSSPSHSLVLPRDFLGFHKIPYVVFRVHVVDFVQILFQGHLAFVCFLPAFFYQAKFRVFTQEILPVVDKLQKLSLRSL